MNAIQVYAVLKKKLNGLASGVQSAVVNGTTITFTFLNGSTSVMTFPTVKDGEDGISVVDVEVNVDNTITCILSDGSEITSTNKITVKDGVDGEDGFSPTIAEDTGNTDEVYKLVVTNENGSYTTPNLMGKGADDTFERTDLTAVTVGGLNSGSSVYSRTTKEVLESILFPYQKPTVSFSINPSILTYQSGDTISSIVFTINVTKKSNDIQSIKIYDGSSLLTAITSGVANGGTFTYTYACNITSNTTLKVEVFDGTSTVSASKSITFTEKSYYGYVANGTVVDETVVKALQNSVVKTIKALTYSGITCDDSKVVYAYPQSQGLLTSILDSNGFNYIDSYTCTNITIDSTVYNVYVMNDSATLDNFKQIFA